MVRAGAGSKAATLGELLREGQPVPSGFRVTCAAFEANLDGAGLGTRVRERLAALALGGTDETFAVG